MIDAVIGGALGGIFRLIPEIMALRDKKDERAHELKLQNSQLEFNKIQGAQRLEEMAVSNQAADVQALKDVLVAQAAVTGNPLADFFNSFVRPYLTYSLSFLYFGVKLSTAFIMFREGVKSEVYLAQLYNVDDQALFWGIVNFWFLDRVIKSRNGK